SPWPCRGTSLRSRASREQATCRSSVTPVSARRCPRSARVDADAIFAGAVVDLRLKMVVAGKRGAVAHLRVRSVLARRLQATALGAPQVEEELLDAVGAFADEGVAVAAFEIDEPVA